MRPIEAVLFDFDGTLAVINIDFPLMRRSILEIILSYGIEADGLAELFVLEMIEAGRVRIVQRDPGLEEVYLKRASALVRDMELAGARRGELFSGVRQMLSALKSSGTQTGVVTRNCLDAVMEIFPDINDFCGIVVSREMAENVKPHPGHLMTALQRLQVSPAMAAMVGDHPMDVQSGKKAGVFTIGVLTGYADRAALSAAGADLIIDSAVELPKYLNKRDV